MFHTLFSNNINSKQLLQYIYVAQMWCLGNLIPFAQFNKREKHLWKSVSFSNVAGY